MKKKKATKPYEVNIDMKYSMDYDIKVSSLAEARKKVWDKFRKRPPRKCFDILAGRAD